MQLILVFFIATWLFCPCFHRFPLAFMARWISFLVSNHFFSGSWNSNSD